MTAAIPDELMQIARGCCTDNDIARALQDERNRATEAERERCAQSAEKKFINRQDAVGRMAFAAGASIAADIRNQTPTGE